MKNSFVYFVIFFFTHVVSFSQELPTYFSPDSYDAIQQINSSGFSNIMLSQNPNLILKNYVLAQQIGDFNKVNIAQKNDAGTEQNNQSYTFQFGNFNESTIGQIGSGNFLLGIQLGYYSYLPNNNENQNIVFSGESKETDESTASGLEQFVFGERNKMTLKQEGENNGMVAIQQGSDNSISASQLGRNNFLYALQQGTNNNLEGFNQANNSDLVLSEKVVQIGDFLTVKSEGAANSNQNGNSFSQIGKNLTLEFNNDLLNTVGGVEINQTGNDMKVVVYQSYFSFPMK